MPKEFKALLCNIYIIFVAAFIPLYTGGSYYGIGDAKYYMFRNVSIFCLGLWVLLIFACVVGDICRHRNTDYVKNKWIIFLKSMSSVDYFMCAYAFVNIMSAICSVYKTTAWQGYEDWHMGAVTQVLLVGIYFFVSREYDRNVISIYAVEAALFIVAVIGLLNRFGADPLGMYKGYTENDWAYSHMISTVGNINWLCGYMAVAAAFCVSAYMNSATGIKKYITFGISCITLTLLLVNGSDIGMLLTVMCMAICTLSGFTPVYKTHLSDFLSKGILLGAAVCILTAVTGNIIILTDSLHLTPDDSFIQGKLNSPIWCIAAVFLLIIYFVCKKLYAAKGYRTAKKLMLAGVVIAALFAMICIILSAWKGISSGDRGKLWKAALQGFAKAPLSDKLIGIGPDCFAQYIHVAGSADGYWEGAIYANAHNEWINQLINIGIAGLAVYIGIFSSAMVRYRGMLLGVIALSMYFINSTVSFQQVMNASVLFIVLGMCENRVRMQYLTERIG